MNFIDNLENFHVFWNFLDKEQKNSVNQIIIYINGIINLLSIISNDSCYSSIKDYSSIIERTDFSYHDKYFLSLIKQQVYLIWVNQSK